MSYTAYSQHFAQELDFKQLLKRTKRGRNLNGCLASGREAQTFDLTGTQPQIGRFRHWRFSGI